MKNLQQTLLAITTATTTALNATVPNFPPMPDVNPINCTATPADCDDGQDGMIIALSLAAIGVIACCVAKKCQTKDD
ncbi:MAG: hypothetical protein ABGY11_12940, partial [Candidatus Thioglobus sp.]